MSEKEKRYIVYFTGAKDNEPGIFSMVAYKGPNGNPLAIASSEHEQAFTYDEGFSYEVARHYMKQTHGTLEEVK